MQERYSYVKSVKELRERTSHLSLGLSVEKRVIDTIYDKYDVRKGFTLTSDQIDDAVVLSETLFQKAADTGLLEWPREKLIHHIRQGLIWAKLSHCDYPPMLHYHEWPDGSGLHNPFIIVTLATEVILWRLDNA